jgi:hypothetical protein
MKDNSGDFSLKGHGGIVTESRKTPPSSSSAGGSPGGPRPPKKDDDEEEKKKKKGCCKEKDKAIERLEKEKDFIRTEKNNSDARANISEAGKIAETERANLLAAELAAKGILDGKMGTAAAFVAGSIVTSAINEVLPKPVSTVYNYIYPPNKKEENNVATKPVASVVDPVSGPKPEPEVG